MLLLYPKLQWKIIDLKKNSHTECLWWRLAFWRIQEQVVGWIREITRFPEQKSEKNIEILSSNWQPRALWINSRFTPLSHTRNENDFSRNENPLSKREKENSLPALLYKSFAVWMEIILPIPQLPSYSLDTSLLHAPVSFTPLINQTLRSITLFVWYCQFS